MMSLEPQTSASPRLHGWTTLALVVAIVVLAGSLWLSLGMKLKACPLCLSQRAFVMGVVGILALGCKTRMRGTAAPALLALPAAVGALGVVSFHEYLEWTGKLECPLGVFGLGTAPQQSLAGLAVLSLVLMVAVARGGAEGGVRPLAIVAAVVLGGLFAFFAVYAGPPMPKPTQPYEGALDGCRSPYVAPAPVLAP
jgi:disulfide bond formation protein DsbB